MLEKKTVWMKGNYAVAEAALQAGLECFFGYPITPSSEIPEYLFKMHEKEKKPRVCLQAESETAAINMLIGAAAAGYRSMSATSGLGISLMCEGVSYAAAMDLPLVLVDVIRGGPGLGNIQPEQGDYTQIVKGGGHGDYKLIVLAPSSVQEMAEHTFLIFNLTDKYRNPGVLFYDGFMGQMEENLIFPEPDIEHHDKSSWQLSGAKNRKSHILNSLYEGDNEGFENLKIQREEKYKKIKSLEQRYELYNTNDADMMIVSFGITSRVSKEAIDRAKQEENINVGLIRPITLWPYPYRIINEFADKVKTFLDIELNASGQMKEDVLLGVNGKADVSFFGRCAGIIPSSDEILEQIVKLYDEKVKKELKC